MGETDQRADSVQRTKEVMENAKPEAIFLHCLPAFHDLGTKVGREIGERFGITDMEVLPYL